MSRRLGWRGGLALLVISGLVGLAVWDGSEGDPAVQAGDVMPPGYWVHARSSADLSSAGGVAEASRTTDDADARARLLSLPYAATGRRAGQGASGVVFHDPEQTWGALNLYTSGHGPEAILIDMEGNFLHRWRYPYDRAFPERTDVLEDPYWRRARLLDDGSLVVLFQAGGLIKVDVRSRLVWRLDRGTYNDVQVAADGTLVTITKQAREISEISAEPILDDALLFVSPDGEPLHSVSILDALRRSPFASMLDARPEHSDILHANTIELIERDDLPPPFARGRVLISARSIDLVALIDPLTEEMVWARQGPWVMQHEPRFLSDGHLLLFDNQGGVDGGTRILELDPLSGDVVWSFAHPAFRSPQAGTCRRLPNGNTLVTSSEGGRAFELNPAGEIVWEFVTPHRGGRHDELVAALWEVIRLGDPTPPWLPGD